MGKGTFFSSSSTINMLKCFFEMVLDERERCASNVSYESASIDENFAADSFDGPLKEEKSRCLLSQEAFKTAYRLLLNAERTNLNPHLT